MIGLERAYYEVDRQTNLLVAEMVARVGIPTGVNQVAAIAETLMPQVLELRRALWADEVRAIRATHPGLDVPDVRFYPQPALERIIRRAAGMEPDSPLVDVTHLDPVTAKAATQRLLPMSMPDEPLAADAFKQLLAANLSMHVKQASRDTVEDAARLNKVRYARVLTGRESCAFCVMLASRGAVYTEQTATKTYGGNAYHSHCDCIAVVVPDVDRWDGKEQADALYEEWTASGGTLKKFRKHLRDNEMEFENGVPMAA